MEVLERADDWLTGRSAQARAIWAKSGTVDGFLTLPQHLIDAACVADWLWDNWVSRSLKRTLATTWGLDEEQVGRLYFFLAGTHDVGKATVTFQTMRPDCPYLTAPVSDAGLPLEMTRRELDIAKFPHGVASAAILRRWLQERGMLKSLRLAVSSVLDAHHGFASDPVLSVPADKIIENYQAEWWSVHRELLDSMEKLAGVADVWDRLIDGEKPVGPALQLMTGLVIMADWIASNETAFPYGLFESQEERLNHATRSVNLPPAWAPTAATEDIDAIFQTDFGWSEDYKARPVQRAVVDAARNADGPALVIIEAPTGEGKTEAGLAAAHVIGEKTGAQGVFFAAPTMSTANGLFERTKQWAERTSVSGEVASMYLAHSKNRLSEDFQELRIEGVGEDDHSTGTVVATDWLSGRRTGILSDFVVGTVDQVLMMALQARFSMLRHVGLAGKVIIIDEVHAYDAYMSEYLYRVLQWLARYGVSVILMSATLPPAQRLKLAQAYASETNDEVSASTNRDALGSPAYPLVSVIDRKEPKAVGVPPRSADMEATIERIPDHPEALSQNLTGLLIDGGIALVICNTIARAQQTFDDLSALFQGKVELHHAGFLANQRSVKEDSLRRRLGPTAHRGDGRPDLQIVVATQVAEQSLDIDADVLVTDIAPIDLIIQRAGRLHRHQRPASDRPALLRQPRIFVRGIRSDNPVPVFDPGASAIYGDKLLLAALANLPSTFTRPDDIAELVRIVYGDDPTVPAAWEEAWTQACADDLQKRQRAAKRADTFRFPDPKYARKLTDLFQMQISDLSGSAGIDGDERGHAQVRDAEPAVEVVAIQNTDYGYIPLGGEGADILSNSEPTPRQTFELASNTVRLPARMTRFDSDFDAVIDDLEHQTPIEWKNSGLLKGQVALRFDDQGEAHAGRFVVRYSSERGLEVAVDKESPQRGEDEPVN